MLGFLFGKKKKRRTVKRRSVKRKGSRKPPARLIKMCKRYKIKCTKKVGKRRVYKSVTVLKKQLRRKLKNKKVRKTRKVRKIRRTQFGKNLTDEEKRQRILKYYNFNKWNQKEMLRFGKM